jgi:hypothetical protein
MLAILFVAATLLTQAYLFRDPETPPGNPQVNTFAYECRSEYAPYPSDASADASANADASASENVSPGKSDSSRTPELASNR